MLEWIQQSGISTAIRQSSWAVMALEAAHLVGLALLGGVAVSVALAAVRSRGLGGISVRVLSAGLAPLGRTGLSLLLVSGALIAISMPFKYYANEAFRWKMLLLLAALLLSWALRRSSARILAVLLLVLWIAVGWCGRLIGFL
jgi:hypothetical protein